MRNYFFIVKITLIIVTKDCIKIYSCVMYRLLLLGASFWLFCHLQGNHNVMSTSCWCMIFSQHEGKRAGSQSILSIQNFDIRYFA